MSPTNHEVYVSLMEDAAADAWRPVPGIPYEASVDGRIRNAKTRRLLKPTVNEKGYEVFVVRVSGAARIIRVHRAVYEAWRGPILDGYQINHLDGVKRNNTLANLEATTASGNSRHALALGLTIPCKGERHGIAKLTDADVHAIRAARQTGETLRSIAERYGVTRWNVGLIVRRKAWAHI